MKAFVTGGSGFIGSHVIDNLKAKGHETYNYDIVEGQDILNHAELTRCIVKFKPDIVFHLAGLLGTSELMACIREAEQVNVVGTINVLEVCKEHGIPLVFASKINPGDWLNPYTITKRAGDDYCAMYQEQWAVQVCISKFLYAYGPRQKAFPVQKLVPSFITRALKGEAIPVWGTGQQHVDPLFVKDAAEAMVRAWENKCWGKTIEVGLGKGIPVITVAKMVLELTGSKSSIQKLPMRPGEPLQSKYRLYADTKLMESLLDMQSSKMVQLSEGLKITIDWWKMNWEKMVVK